MDTWKVKVAVTKIIYLFLGLFNYIWRKGNGEGEGRSMSREKEF